MAAILLGFVELSLGAAHDAGGTKGKVEMVDTQPARPAATTAGRWETLFGDEAWYRQQPGAEAQFSGVLERVIDIGPGSAMQRQALYRLGDRAIYTGGQRMPAMEAWVGRSVVIRGKVVEFPLEGRQVREIWPAAVQGRTP